MEREANRQKANEKKHSSGKPQSHSSSQRSGAILAGVDCKTYARSRSLSEEQVWQKVLNGELQGRTHQGRLYIVEQDNTIEIQAVSPEVESKREISAQEHFPEQRTQAHLEMPDFSEFNLPPIPIDIEASNQEHYMEVVERKVSLKSTTSQDRGLESIEAKVLLEHLSQMQSEQQELLSMTKTAIEKITDQANQIVQAKDEILSMKNAELERLQQEKKQVDIQLKKAQQEIEDLTMLNDTLSASEQAGAETSPFMQ